ncbi:DnaB-like helicase C-terminal domain-containing protein [Rufibacter quisquiliarum]|uniref:Twinkle protein n=1 Tax=Rufibacter quisquiliarum TaxID=1549639 RepID=A0A839GV42_9BACT|nr:DnaB-like helicase C-terminal domain-containing protein [Rufibacter quisquiliarum]MBA9078298.1 twinkle protein [Rufibacter quisquiliarum]
MSFGAEFLQEEEVLEQRQLPKESPRLDFKKGIYRVSDVSKEMDHTFHNGKPRGITTHIPDLDAHFTWKSGELTCVTGYPQHGKTEFTLFLMLLKAVYEGWRWVIFSPENYPAPELFDTLIHTYIGMSVDPYYGNRMSHNQYQRGKEFIDAHFVYVYPQEAHTPEVIREYVEYLTSGETFSGTLKDPWNKMVHSYTGRDDLYLASQLPLEQKVAREKNLCSIITAHPRAPGNLKNGDDFPHPTQYNLSGGAMWDNMCDNILCLHRPDFLMDKTSTRTQFHSLKIKKQKLVGIPGMVEFMFERRSNRYLYNGASPLVRPGVQPEIEMTHHVSKIPGTPGRDFIEPKFPF